MVYIKKIYKLLISVRLALVLIITLTILSILGMLVPQKGQLSLIEIQVWQNKYPIWSKIIDQLGLDKIFSSSFFLVIAFIFLLNTIACTIKQIEIAYKQWAKYKSTNEKVIKYLTNSFTLNTQNPKIINQIEELIKTKGFTSNRFENSLQGNKRRLGYWGSSVFHIGLVVIVFGVFISFAYKAEGRVNLTEGQTFTGNVDQYITFTKGPLAKEPSGEFTLTNEKVNSKTNNHLTEEYSSEIAVLGNNGQIIKKQEVKTNNNLQYRGYTFYPYEYGYSPAIIIEEKGTPIFSAYSELITKITNDKREYNGDIKLLNQGLVVNVTFIPNILKENAVNTKNVPAVLYNIKDINGRSLYKGSLSQGQESKVGNYLIKFPEYRMWAGFIVVKDYGVYFIYIGGLCAILGLFILYFWVPQTIFIIYRHNQDKTLDFIIGGISKKYSINFAEEFQELKEQILLLNGGKND